MEVAAAKIATAEIAVADGAPPAVHEHVALGEPGEQDGAR
jgi:hypothetical protein